MDINKTFNASLLAQASYSDGLVSGSTGTLFKNDLIDSDLDSNDAGVANGITSGQADFIASNYRVIYQKSTTTSGFSATLFQDVNTGEYIFSTRGTDGDGPDWTDANLDNALSGVSRNQVVDMLNFYLRLTQSGDVQQYNYEEVSSVSPPNQPYYIVNAGIGPVPIPTYAIVTVDATVSGLGVINENAQLTVAGHSLGGHLASAFTLLFPDASSLRIYIIISRCISRNLYVQ